MLKVINSIKHVRNLSGAEVGALPIGTTFLGTIEATGHRTLGARIYSGVVDLENLSKTWSATTFVAFPSIADFQEVDVEAIIKEIG